MTSRVLTVLGGGSAYAPGLVQALLHHWKKLGLSELRLHDIDSSRLEIVGTLARRMTEAAGTPFRVAASANIDEVLGGTDVVLNSTRPGGLEARHLDETLPLEFEIPGQETVGPGGFFFALRSVPYTMMVAERLQALSPEAVLLNYTNPTNIVSQALATKTKARFIGLCDQSDEDLETLATALGEEGMPTFHCAGLNHATWYSDLKTQRGAAIRVTKPVPPPLGLDEEHQLRFALSFDLWTQEPSGWPNSYLPYYTHPESFVDLARRRGSRARIIEASLPDYYQHFREEAARAEPRLRRHRGTAGFGDLAVRTLIALAGSEPQKLVLNLSNQGASRDFESETVIEAPVELGATGLQRTALTDLPPFLKPLLSRLERYQIAAMEVSTSSRSTAVLAEALAENPLVPDRKTASALIERALRSYGPGVLEA